MFYVYLLKSEVDKKLYIGSTNDLKKRLIEHNEGKVSSTKHRKPFALVYYEAYKIESDARLREKSLKLRGQARVHLLRRVSKSFEKS